MHLTTARKTCILITLCLLLAPLASHVRAVESGKTSYTAEAVCALRSIGASDPDPKTRNPDHMAKLFVNLALKKSFPGLGLDFEAAKVAMDMMRNGAYYYVNARTLHMDALLTQALKTGCKQVVIMGAGFDSRAYRFHEDYPDVQFFEIDLPATSADKQQRVEKILGKRPNWVTFVPIDFNTQTLNEVLGKAGFSRDKRTFYVWEGVTYFISKAGVDSTMRHIAKYSAPGSLIVFDYMLEDVVQGMDYSAYGARRTTYFVSIKGEPYTFGIAPQQLETFINLRGLALLSDLGPDDLTQRYLIRSDGTVSGKIAGFVRIVYAEVPEMTEQQRLIGKAESRMSRFKPNKAPFLTNHRVDIPDDVQSFLSAYSDTMVCKDFVALREFYSENYLSNGFTREQVVGWIQGTRGKKAIHQYEIILTRFNQKGNKAKIDGYIQRKGYRRPLMTVDIVKETDGRWRWYGNQR